MSSHTICSPSTGKVVVGKGRPYGHPGLQTKNLLRQREGWGKKLGGREDMTPIMLQFYVMLAFIFSFLLCRLIYTLQPRILFMGPESFQVI